MVGGAVRRERRNRMRWKSVDARLLLGVCEFELESSIELRCCATRASGMNDLAATRHINAQSIWRARAAAVSG
jgi:hypothetical protein